jgi:hypothetical protein
MSADETHIVVDWVKPTENSIVVVKQPNSKIWTVLRIVTPFLGGLFSGLVSAYFIYNY